MQAALEFCRFQQVGLRAVQLFVSLEYRLRLLGSDGVEAEQITLGLPVPLGLLLPVPHLWLAELGLAVITVVHLSLAGHCVEEQLVLLATASLNLYIRVVLNYSAYTLRHK